MHEDLKTQSMRIYACREPDAVGIIIEGIPVLTDLGNIESPISAQTIQNIQGLLKTFCGTRYTVPKTNLQVHWPQKQAPYLDSLTCLPCNH